jgi:hypothetical protein
MGVRIVEAGNFFRAILSISALSGPFGGADRVSGAVEKIGPSLASLPARRRGADL